MMMGASTGCNTVYGSTPPSNPHPYPWMNSLFQDGATISWLLAGAILTPTILLLPKVAQAPEMASARAWATHNVARAQQAFRNARQRAHELWLKEPGKQPAPGEP